MTTPSLTDRIDATLPQTQCTRCGYADCRAYAEAVATGLAEINQCPPGGAEGVARLAAVTGRPSVPLDPAHGVEGPRRIAVVDEAWCIGCTLCIDACPVDAIVGAPKRMHGVWADGCTGCELCLPPCPMDCIHMQPLSNPALAAQTGWSAWSDAQAQRARLRYAGHRSRLEPRGHKHQDGLPTTGSAMQGEPAKTSAPMLPADSPPGEIPSAARPKSELIAAALERARQRQAQRKN